MKHWAAQKTVAAAYIYPCPPTTGAVSRVCARDPWHPVGGAVLVFRVHVPIFALLPEDDTAAVVTRTPDHSSVLDAPSHPVRARLRSPGSTLVVPHPR